MLMAIAFSPVFHSNLGFNEGVFIPSTARNLLDWDWVGNFWAETGVGAIVGNKEAFVVAQIKYRGPGVSNAPVQTFRDKYLDFYFSGSATLPDPENRYFLKPHLDFMYEFYKAGKNESWETGLYNFWAPGGGVDFGLWNGLLLGLNITYFSYPNYIDALSLYTSGQISGESGGKQNNISVTFTGTVPLKALKAEQSGYIDWQATYSHFLQQKVITESGTYGDELQRQFYFQIFWKSTLKLSDLLWPNYSFGTALNLSNQNEIYRPSVTALTIQFLKDFYSYVSFEATPGLRFNLSEKHFINVAADATMYFYFNRPVFDQETYLYNLDEKERTFILILTGQYTIKMRVTTFNATIAYEILRTNNEGSQANPNINVLYIGMGAEYSF